MSTKVVFIFSQFINWRPNQTKNIKQEKNVLENENVLERFLLLLVLNSAAGTYSMSCMARFNFLLLFGLNIRNPGNFLLGKSLQDWPLLLLHSSQHIYQGGYQLSLPPFRLLSLGPVLSSSPPSSPTQLTQSRTWRA